MTTTTRKKELKKGVLSYTVAFTLCVCVAIFRYITGDDIMSLTVFRSKIIGDMTGEKGVYSLWPISHFILYVCLGYIAPSWWWLWICLGVGWEIFEYCGGVLVRNLQSKQGTESLGKKAEKMLMPQYGNEWVTGCQSDILFNVTGLILGLVISKFSVEKSHNQQAKLNYKVIYSPEDNIFSTSSQTHKDKGRYDRSYVPPIAWALSEDVH